MKDKELRFSREFRMEGEGEERKIVGYAAVFNSPADIAGYFSETIAPGAFSEAIQNDDVRALFDHDSAIVLGRNKAGTLALTEDDKGLKVEISPPDTQAARDLITLMERGDVNQTSFGFRMRGGKESWDDSQDPPLRTIEKIGELFDVSVVTYPAYPTTEAAVRSLDKFKASKQEPVNPVMVTRRLRLAEMDIAS